MHHSRSLQQSIPYLVDEVDAKLREQLRQTLDCLHSPLVALQAFQNPLLQFCTLLFERVGKTRPNDDPFDCILLAGSGDPDKTKKKPGLKLFPPEMESYLHTVRVTSAKLRHDVEKMKTTSHDVEISLSLLLRVLEWFYCEFDRGRTFTTIYRPLPEITTPPRIVELLNLPITLAFQGRADDLRRLEEAWDDPHTNVLTIHAWGGVGKSALVGHWIGELGGEDYRGAQAVYGYSLEGAAGDVFIERGLRLFGDADPTQGSPEDKGKRLAELVRQRRTLLWLDGFQAVQEQEGEIGRIKSPALRSLVCTLAAYNPGLCVISTRLPILDLNIWTRTAPSYELRRLSKEAGAKILEKLGVLGPPEELERAADEVQGHALSLSLLGAYLYDAWDGDVYRRNEIRLLAEEVDTTGQARRIMDTYARFLEDKQPRALAILRLVSLFFRPVKPEAVTAILAKPAIEGLTADLVGLRQPQWNMLVSYLRKHKLLLEAPADPDPKIRAILDAHPLVRDYFADRLRRENPLAYEQAHLRLYDYFCGSVSKYEPDTNEQMGPLYLSVIHACHAEAYDDVFEKVYWPRIKRGDQHFNTKRLGAFVADLTVLRKFFESCWDRLRQPIGDSTRARILYAVAFDLRALGRLEEAIGPMRACLEACIEQKEWIDAAKIAGDLSLLYITLGDLGSALDPAKEAVVFADRSGCPFESVRARSNLINILIQRGSVDVAEVAFREAEEIVREDAARAEPPQAGKRRPTLQSYWFYDLLLELKEYGKIEELVALPPPEHTATGMPLLDQAFADLALGRVRMGQAAETGASGRVGGLTLLDEARTYLTRALKAMDEAKTEHHRPRVLLTRAALFRSRNEWELAAGDLQLARVIAERGNMKIHLADSMIQLAHLHLARGDRHGAAEMISHVRHRVREMEYHRRAPEVEELVRILAVVS